MAVESDLIRRYRGAFSPEECLKLREDIDFLEDNNIIGYDKTSLHKVDNKTYNVTWDYTFDVCASTRIASKIFEGFKPCVDEYLETFSTLGRRRYLVYDCKLKKIPVAGGFHNWHYENGSIEYASRAFVIQLYLNDNFEGGETEFLYQNRREEAVEGDVLIFPSAYTHTHRGNPPIGNVKYLATSWGIIQGGDDEQY